MATPRPRIRRPILQVASSGAAMDRALPESPRWRRYLPVILASLALSSLAVVLGMRPSNLPVVDAPRLARVQLGEFRDEVSVRAHVEPLRSVQLDAVEGGRVEAVFAREGEVVEAGAPLYRLQSPEQEQLLMQRSAEVAQQLANMSVQRSAHAASLAEARRDLTLLKGAQQKAEAHYQRLKLLAGTQVVALATVEDAERDYRLATDLLSQAREDQRLESAIRQRSLDELALAVDGLQKGLQGLEQARARLEQHAPITGRLSGFQLQVGMSVRPGDRLGRIDDAEGGIQLVADVDEYYLPRLQPGQPVATAGNGDLFLAQTLPQVREGRARVLLHWADGHGPPSGLQPGQAVEARIQLSTPTPALLLSDGPGVRTPLYVRNGHELHRRNVQLGRRAAGQVEVLGGLRDGDEVLISEPPADVEKLRLP